MDISAKMKLNNKVEMPMLGLGVFKSSQGYQTSNAVKWALEAGYRHIDTAAIYGNEDSVAEGIRESKVLRKDIFITTKLWNEDMRNDNQLKAFERSLLHLGTDYIDLYLIHWPVQGKIKESWKVLEKLYEEKRVRAIGVSNFQKYHLEKLFAKANIIPAVNQVECHPKLNQQELYDFCRGYDIALESWSPLGGSHGDLLDNQVLKQIALNHDKSVAQVIIRWNLQRNIIVIPKSVHKERIIENAEVYDFALTQEEMDIILGINENRRFGADPDKFDF